MAFTSRNPDIFKLFFVAGYPSRGADIRGIIDNDDPVAKDKLPFTILSYANGKSFYDHLFVNETTGNVSRIDVTTVNEYLL